MGDRQRADVVVIGAGHNSLIAAAYLAAAGLEVAVLEERDVVGGNTVTEELTLPGFAHDSCSSAHVLLQSNPLIRDDELGLLADGLTYVHTDPAVVHITGDAPIVMWADRERTAEAMASFSARDAEAYLQLLAEWEQGLRTAHARWNAGTLDPDGSADDARYELTRRRTALDVIDERFEHRRVRDFIAWLSFLTIQPIDRRGTGILPFATTAGRQQFGWATPIGGSGALPQALMGNIEKNGGRVLTGKYVTTIEVVGGRAVAVRTTSGERFAARRAVLSSAHLTQLGGMLAGCDVPARLQAAADAWRPGLTLFAVHLALRGQVEYPTPGGTLLSVAGGLGGVEGLRAQLDAFGSGQAYAEDPWLLVVCSTLADPARAVHGGGTAKLLTVAPYGIGRGAARDRYAAALLERAGSVLSGLEGDDILAVKAEGPADLERRNRHNVAGSCHGGELAGADGEPLPGWPDHRLPVPGLYQTGATSHPGGSVAGRAGRNAARVLLTDLGVDPAQVMGQD